MYRGIQYKCTLPVYSHNRFRNNLRTIVQRSTIQRYTTKCTVTAGSKLYTTKVYTVNSVLKYRCTLLRYNLTGSKLYTTKVYTVNPV